MVHVMVNYTALALCITIALMRIMESSASYLDRPRIHFAGQYRADSNTRNNMPCNFDPTLALNPDLNQDWNFNGTNEFSLYNPKVTSIVSSDGIVSTPIGLIVTDSRKRPFAKLADIDVDYQGAGTIVYGMIFSLFQILADGSEQLVFNGNVSPNIVSQDMWPRAKCYHGDQDSFPLGSLSQTVLTDVQWGTVQDFPVFQQLKQISENNGNKLSVSVSLYHYTRNYPEYVQKNFTLGNIIGSIGPYLQGEPLNIGGPRWLQSVPDSLPEMSFEEDDSCHDVSLLDYFPWVYNAPFKIQIVNEVPLVTVDIGNSLPIHVRGFQRNLGDLRLGIQHTNCVDIISSESIPYTTEMWLETTGGVVDYVLTSQQFQDLTTKQLQLGFVQVVSSAGVSICSDVVFPSLKGTDYANVLLSETQYILRPTEMYVGRVDDDIPLTIEIYVTEYGEPATYKQVHMFLHSVDNLPSGGVTVDSDLKETEESGLVSFTFTKTGSIPYPRQYGKRPEKCSAEDEKKICDPDTKICVLPIEGQAYQFNYCIQFGDESCTSNKNLLLWPIVVLGFSDFEKPSIPTWSEHIEPIFSQYKHLTGIMNTILDLGNYSDVTLLWNINLLKISMGELPFEAADFMPVTRDLSPKKTQMILQWLDDPKYSETSYDPGYPSTPVCESPDITLTSRFALPIVFSRCQSTTLKFSEFPRVSDEYFSELKLGAESNKGILRCKARALRGFVEKSITKSGRSQCTLESLQDQLQIAVQLEFSTIPLYLTSLYSFVDNCNVQAVELIRSIIMQEMLHFTQAANMLVATGKFPLIDSATTVPVYPHKGLPGCVLPDLYLTLKKASLPHIYYTFMGVEVPAETLVGDPPVHAKDTIGEFYNEVQECIEQLYNEDLQVFDPDSSEQQVQWPWNSSYVGELVVVDSLDTAKAAINLITTQGEGANPINPEDTTTGMLAHFFRFEEIVCQKRLEKVDQSHYAYSGSPIPFDAQGVWPMRDNPKAADLIKNTNCYTEAKVFHQIYRSLLRSLQLTFSGSPETIKESVRIMETMKAHAKRLMWIKYNPENEDDITTCGPVFDYNWPLE